MDTNPKTGSSASRNLIEGLLGRLASSYMATLTNDVAQVYYDALGDLSENDLRLAFREIARTWDGKFIPPPAKIRAALESARARLPKPKSLANQDCVRCGGTGFEIIEHDGDRFARRCSCTGSRS